VTSLDRACRRAIAAGTVGVLCASLAAAAAFGPIRAATFLALALASFFVVASTLWRSRVLAEGERALGLATGLTLLRGLLVSLVAGFTFVPALGAVRWWPAALYAAAAIADRADGLVARRLGHVTALGAHLDGAMDALGMLTASIVGVMWRRLPPWYLLLGAAYYVYQAAIWLRLRIGWPVYTERVRRRRETRWFAGAQMILIVASLPPVLSLGLTSAVATVLMLPTLVFFVRDWITLIGWTSAPEPDSASATAPAAPRGTPSS
jgi:CDP-diacylglycerol--glycerol-3-phosphate 3-phosphatidyltransferase